jgi:hypothetical protein
LTPFLRRFGGDGAIAHLYLECFDWRRHGLTLAHDEEAQGAPKISILFSNNLFKVSKHSLKR